MEKHKPEQQGVLMEAEIGEFVHTLSEVTGEFLPVEYIDGTYEIEADTFTLTFTVDTDVFEIRNIDVRGNAGLGHQVVEAIHEYADENDLEVIASNVRDTAIGFWQKMGYQEGDGDEEYFRAA